MPSFVLQRDNHICHVIMSGNLIASIVTELQQGLKSEIEHGAIQVVFDLSKTTMVDSSGIGLLIATNNSLARTRGGIKIINVSTNIYKLFQSMRLTQRLDITPASQ